MLLTVFSPTHRSIVLVWSQVKTDFQKHYNIAILSGKHDASRTFIVFQLRGTDLFCHVFGSRTKTKTFENSRIVADGALKYT